MTFHYALRLIIAIWRQQSRGSMPRGYALQSYCQPFPFIQTVTRNRKVNIGLDIFTISAKSAVAEANRATREGSATGGH
jgi:hypothetical protein